MGTKILSERIKTQFSIFAAIFAILTSGGVGLAQSYSHARIVRLSFTQGTVSIERPDSPQWEAAPTNTPVQEGYKLSTAADSYAEVEFENSSTVRLGEQSELDFTKLALASSGAKINRMDLTGGYATFTVIPESGDVYEVTAGESTLSPSGNSTFRVDLEQGAERVEVFKGLVGVTSSYGSSQLSKNDVLEIDPGADQAYVISHGITPDDWDKWVENRQQVLNAQYDRQSVQASNPYPDYSSYYGWNDLMYYGDWNYVPGYGYGWCPYTAAGWMPYTVGQWVWYPGLGWTWVSAEPWGWMPFHYGYWMFLSGAGWYWFPGGLGPWSPALVTWYEGNGWVGWSPKGAQGRPAVCVASRNCFVAVGTGAFQRGRMISGGELLNVEATAGRSVSSPTIAPLKVSPLIRGRIVTGPGRNSAGSGVTPSRSRARVPAGENVLFFNRRARDGAGAPSVVLPAYAGGSTRSSSAPGSGIVFDSKTRSYVNSPNPAPAAQPEIRTQPATAPSPERRPVGASTPESGRPASAPQIAPAKKPDHHWDFFGLLGNRKSPESGSHTESGAPGPGNSAPSSGTQTRSGNSAPAPERISVPREAPAPRPSRVPAPAPRSEPEIRSAPSPHISSSTGSGGSGGGPEVRGRPH